MKQTFLFTFDYIKQQYQQVLNYGYTVITCEQYITYKRKKETFPVLVNRVDIDLSVKKTENLIDIFNDLGIKATFFLRLHAPEYNPFSFDNYRIIKKLLNSGHELGYHSEVIDQSVIWGEDPTDCLWRDIEIINRIFNTEIRGVASHGGMTGLNNLDFWGNKKAKDFGLLYEAYDKEPEFNLFQESFYVSDSEWIRWKCYNKGQLVEGDRRSLAEHLPDGHQIIHALIHPDTYYKRHLYE
ncbi:MAG: hypothetical protein M0Q41_07495 [Bacteroidales bacterium]|nr:hypothetical protein [Acholeplasmataceae bacterium]MCK9448809.1 hypothetical protein [Bacteroidales bacterium]